MDNDVTGRLDLEGKDRWRVEAIHQVAKALGLLIHVNGMPYGKEQPPEPGVKGAISKSL